MYRKSYAGFIVWMIVFIAAMFAIALIPTEDPAVITRMLMNLCTIGMAVLAWMVWHSDRVYWYTSVSFDEAEKAGSERRKEYAFRHFRLFGGYALAALAFTLGGHLAGWPWWIDMMVIPVGLIAAAFRTMKYRL